MSDHWEMDLWKECFGRLVLVFLVLQAVFIYSIWNQEAFMSKFFISAPLFGFVYVASFWTWLKAKRHEKQRLIKTMQQAGKMESI